MIRDVFWRIIRRSILFVGINTENAETTAIDINGNEAVYFYDNHNYSHIIWDNGDYIIDISSNIDKNALISIAKSVEKVG